MDTCSSPTRDFELQPRTLSSYEFRAPANINAVMAGLNDQRRSEGHLCDVVLRSGDSKFTAHRCVLSAACAYFKSMFEQNHFSESHNEEVQLCSVSPEVLAIILDYVYTGVLRVTSKNVHQVLASADHMLMNQAQAFCIEFMFMLLSSRNATQEAIEIRKSAELFSITQLAHEAYRVISRYFADVTKSDAFKYLSFAEVQILLGSDEICETNENVFWDGAIRWIQHDLESRQQYIDLLMSKVRFPLMDGSTLIQIQDHFLMKSENCQNYVHEGMTYILMEHKQSQMQSERSRPRCGLYSTIVYCLSGTTKFKCYIPQYDKWFSLCAPSVWVSVDATQSDLHMTLLIVDGRVYACGQYRSSEQTGSRRFESLQQYDVTSNTWKTCSLPTVPMAKTLVECNNSLYACSSAGIQYYDPSCDTWTVVTDTKLRPHQFCVSDVNSLHFYNLTDGTVQQVYLEPSFSTNLQVMSPVRFVADVFGVCKLSGQDVLVCMRSLGGVTRKIYNLRSNLWRDANLYHGINTVQPKAGQHFPACLDLEDRWQVVCDRNEHTLFVLGTKSGLCNIPGRNDSGAIYKDAVLPFYAFSLKTKCWTRLASLPEHMSDKPLQLCIRDGHNSMATVM